MNISNEKAGDILIVSVTGLVNKANAAALESDFLAAIDESPGMGCVLDLTHLSHISSAGLRVVLAAAKHIKMRSGELVVCGLRPSVREIFESAGFPGILPVLPTRADALQQLNRPAPSSP